MVDFYTRRDIDLILEHLFNDDDPTVPELTMDDEPTVPGITIESEVGDSLWTQDYYEPWDDRPESYLVWNTLNCIAMYIGLAVIILGMLWLINSFVA